MNDNVQHGIDDNPHNDAEKGAALGGLGGAAVGAAAGSIAGPVGTVVGAIAGGLLGAGASGVAVAAVDSVDNDNTITGVGSGVTDLNDSTVNIRSSSDAPLTGGTPIGGHNVVTGGPAVTNDGNTGIAAGAIAGGLLGTVAGGPIGAIIGGTAGALAGGVSGDAIEAIDDTPGASVNSAPLSDDVLRPSMQTDYRNVDSGLTSIGVTDQNADTALTGGYDANEVPGVRMGGIGNDVPGIQTGGMTSAGPDTRGISEKAADAITGDRVDDKTGGIV